MCSYFTHFLLFEFLCFKQFQESYRLTNYQFLILFSKIIRLFYKTWWVFYNLSVYIVGSIIYFSYDKSSKTALQVYMRLKTYVLQRIKPLQNIEFKVCVKAEVQKARKFVFVRMMCISHHVDNKHIVSMNFAVL